MQRPGEDTLIRYFRGQCTAEENHAVQLYLAMDIDADYVEQCLREAWRPQLETPVSLMNEAVLDQRWRQFTDLRPAEKPVKRIWFRYAAAAVVLLAATSTAFLLTHQQPGTLVAATQSFSAPKGKARKLKLADSSFVTLFPGAEIQVPGNYNQQQRTITLKGRAFFEIAADAQRPFAVKTASLTTHVLGTSFDIDEGASNRVTLLSGKVSVHYAAKELAVLSPGQQVVFDTATHNWQVSQVNAKDAIAWTAGEFIYENAPLQQVFRDIENWYDIDIHTSHSSILRQKINTNFKGLALKQVMDLISKATGLHYNIQGKHVSVTAAGEK